MQFMQTRCEVPGGLFGLDFFDPTKHVQRIVQIGERAILQTLACDTRWIKPRIALFVQLSGSGRNRLIMRTKEL
jgi:hypothetical protein